MSTASSRPREILIAGVMTIVGSVLALVGIFSSQGELRSSQVRSEIESLLADQQLTPVDVSVDTVLNLLEVGLMVASAASVAAIVLAVYVMRRHNPSRIALTLLGGVAALLLLLSWPVGLVVALFVVYTISLLWRAPVRQWFAMAPDGAGGGSGGGSGGRADDSGGRADGPRGDSDEARDPARPAPPPATGPAGSGESTAPVGPEQPGPYPKPWPPPQEPPAQQPSQEGPPPETSPQQPQPGAYGYPPGPGGQAGGPVGYPAGPPAGQGYPSGYYGYPPPYTDPDKRPAQLVTAHVMTWVGTGLFLLAGVFFLLATASPEVVDMVIEQLPTGGASPEEFVTTLRVVGVLTALWSLAVLVVSVFSWRRANWAAIALTVMGGAYLALQLVSLLVMGQVAVIVTITYVTAVIVLLWWPASRQWYARRRRGGHHGPPGGGSSYPQQPQPPKRSNQPW